MKNLLSGCLFDSRCDGKMRYSTLRLLSRFECDGTGLDDGLGACFVVEWSVEAGKYGSSLFFGYDDIGDSEAWSGFCRIKITCLRELFCLLFLAELRKDEDALRFSLPIWTKNS